MRKILIILGLTILIHQEAQASVSSSVQKGNQYYSQGEYEKALKEFEKANQKAPDSDITNFNLGSTMYKNKDYVGAIDHFNKSLLSEDPLLKEKAHYNLGNSLFYLGLSVEKKNLDGAIDNLEKSIEQFDAVLANESLYDDAQFNKEIVQKELERLKQKKQQEDQENKDEKKDQQDKDKNQQPKDNKEQDKQNKEDQKNQEKEQPQDSQDKNNSNEDTTQPQNDQQEKDNDKDSDQDGEDTKDENKKGTSQENKDDEDAETKKQEADEESGQSGEEGMSKREAKILLEDYLQNDEPKTMLNFGEKQLLEKDVQKDW